MSSPFLNELRTPGAVRAVELRPPRAGLAPRDSVDAWIETHHGVRRLLAANRFVLFTDDAVGQREEESIRVLTSNLGMGRHLSRIIPFLTCKHTLDYCLLFARRAASHEFGALTVTGGDSDVGPPRCLPHSRDLRQRIRAEVPELALGAWVNPFADPVEQVELLLDPEHHADYFLTQVVSHHALAPLDRFLDESTRRGLDMPGLVGVFYYRSARRETLERLAHFLPVPVEGVQREFADGASPEEALARTLRALSERGLQKVYVSNLDPRRAETRLRLVEGRADCTPGGVAS